MMKPFAFAITAVLAAYAGSAEAGQALTPRDIYKTYGPSVVLVFGTDGSAQGSAGTGSIITADGQIVTNAHVVSKDGTPYKKLFVYLKPEKLKGSMKHDLQHRYKATLVDIDPQLDLALLRMVDPPKELRPIEFVDPEAVEIGEPVVAIGHPETGGLWTLTTGSISSVVADFQGVEGKDVFQTEASVNRGNSGGPLLNAYGQMIGINTCISRKAADGLAITDINFSLKASVPVEWFKKRRLMTLAYAQPGTDSIPDTAVAAATPPKEDPKAPGKKPKETLVDAGDGKTQVAVVEPGKNQEVAEDPEFQKAADTNVSRGMEGSDGPASSGKPAAKEASVKPKHLTKTRPYKIEAFVDERVKEIKALEQMMDEMSGKIQQKKGKGGDSKKKSGDSMGLW